MLIIGGIILGFFGGLVSSLFGGGSGLIFIPGIFWLLVHVQGAEHPYLMKIALGTCFCLSMPIGLIATVKQFKYKNIHKATFFRFGPFIIAGAGCGAIAVMFFNTSILKTYFSVMILLVAVWMWQRHRKDKKNALTSTTASTSSSSLQKEQSTCSTFLYRLLGLLVGGVSTSVGVAVFSVPFLIKAGLDMRQSVAVSTVVTFSFSILCTLIFLIIGFILHIHLINLSIVIGGIIPTLIGSAMGAKLAHVMPQDKLRLLFIVLMAVVAGLMAMPHH